MQTFRSFLGITATRFFGAVKPSSMKDAIEQAVKAGADLSAGN